MTSKFSLNRRDVPIALLLVGVAAIAAGCIVLMRHAQAFSDKRDMAIAIGEALPALRSEVAMLDANIEAERILGADKHAAREEQASAYILPAEPDGARAAAAVEEIASALSQNGSPLRLRGIGFAHEAVSIGDHRELAMSVVMDGDIASVARLLTAVEFSGDLSVRDVLSPDDALAFLEIVEKGAPLTLPDAEEFLFSDIIAYAADADALEKRMTRDMPVDIAAAARSTLLKAGLSDLRLALSAVAPSLKQRRLWPLPLLRVDSLEQKSEREWVIGMTVFGRAGKNEEL